MFHGNEIGTIILDPEFLPRKLDWYNLKYIYYEDDFFEIMSLLPEFSGNFKIFWFSWDLKAKLWVHELTAQTERVKRSGTNCIVSLISQTGKWADERFSEKMQALKELCLKIQPN